MRNIIIIAFYFKPFKGVGAFRLSYWYDRLKKAGYDVKVITSTEEDNNEKDPCILRIPIRTKLNKILPLDSSYQWGKQIKPILKEFLNNNSNSVVLLTGGPYMHFNTLLSLKRKFPKSKWIIDYRDPLAKNPRHISKSLIGKFRNIIKIIYERKINNLADTLITVNIICKDLIVGNHKNVNIIDNGYDERIVTNVNQNNKEKGHLIYAGQLYNISIFKELCDTLTNTPAYKLIYVGNANINSYTNNQVQSLGFLSYAETIENLKMAEIGVIITNGDPFESTTKIFDYFAAKLKILIITAGKERTGNLYKITKNNPNVEWSHKDSYSIVKALRLLSRPYIEWNYEEYSRDKGFRLLESLLNK